MSTLRLAERWEQYPLRCSAKRSRYSRVFCDRMALHRGHHAARGRFGQWFLW